MIILLLFQELFRHDTSLPPLPNSMVEESNKEQLHPMSGLLNVGQSCFLNSILFCLASIPEFSEKLKRTIEDNFFQKSDLLTETFQLLTQISSGKFKVVSPLQVKEILGKSHPYLLRNQQEDAQELFLNFISTLNSEVVSQLSTPGLENLQQSFITDMFRGQLRQIIECDQCFFRSEQDESFFDLSLPMQTAGKSSLIDSLCLYSAPELLNFECPDCTSKNSITKKTNISKIPEVLVLSFKRFSSDEGSRQKISSCIDFPTMINFHQLLGINNETQNYKLVAISNHKGSLEEGHYFSTCFCPRINKWCLCNDVTVLPFKETELHMFGKTAYVLFYQSQKVSKWLRKYLVFVIRLKLYNYNLHQI